MKDTTRDFVAMELLILATLAVASLITPFLLSALGLWVPPTYIGGVLYLFRWTWWAVQHCRSRAIAGGDPWWRGSARSPWRRRSSDMVELQRVQQAGTSGTPGFCAIVC